MNIDYITKQTVYHELVHAAYGIGHLENNKLMQATYGDPAESAELDTLFREFSMVGYMLKLSVKFNQQNGDNDGDE
jgi:hypothetical protein